MARMSEATVRAIEDSRARALEYVVALHSPHRMLARVVKAHFPNAPRDMRWSVSSSVRTRDQGQSRTTFAGYPAKLRADAREDEINANSAPCVLDMTINAPWYNAIILECECDGRDCEPGRGWFVDLAFDPLEPRLTATATTTATATAAVSAAATSSTTAAAAATTTTVPVPAPAPSAPSAMTNNAPVSVVVSVSQSASRTFPCPYCATPYAYANQAGLRRHIAKCH